MIRPASDPDSGRPLVEPVPSGAPGGRPAAGDGDLAAEVAALAALLADVVGLAGDSALFPGRWALIAELALEHDSVRAALRTEETGAPLGTEQVMARIHCVWDLVGGGRGWG